MNKNTKTIAREEAIKTQLKYIQKTMDNWTAETPIKDIHDVLENRDNLMVELELLK